MTSARPGQRTLFLGALALITFIVGFLGQGWWAIGARARSPAISAIATDAIGGAGSRQPIRIRVTIAVANAGADEIQVFDPAQATAGVSVVGLDPPVLTVPRGRIGRLNADLAVRCDRAAPLSLPALRVELIDGVRHRLEVGGSGLLLEACARASAAIRPLAVSIADPAGQADPARTPKLTIVLTSPTGRRVDVSAIRAGGVTLATVPQAIVVTGTADSTVRLTAPASCPIQWRVPGVPGSLAFDLAAKASGSLSTVQLRLGPALTSWLLATSCRGSG